MGLFSRLRNLNKPRASGTGRIWDNVNSAGGGVGTPTSRVNNAITTTPLQNYFTPGPNPEFYLKGVGYRSPFRKHSHYVDLQEVVEVQEPRSNVGYGFVNDGNSQPGSSAQGVVQPTSAPVIGIAPSQKMRRDVDHDAGNRVYQAVPDQPLQQYFNEKVPMPEFTTPAQYAHSVMTSVGKRQRGWFQAYVPNPGMRLNEVGFSPPTLLSKPIQSTTRQAGSLDGTRSPIKRGKAPSRKKSGG